MGGTRQRKSGTDGTTLLRAKVKSLASGALPGPSLFHLSGVLFHLSFHLVPDLACTVLGFVHVKKSLKYFNIKQPRLFIVKYL